MRDQYVADISDMLKYALLRLLAGADRSLGIAWYYNPDHDGRTDGGHREYLQDSTWSTLDGHLWRALKDLPEPRTVAAIEALPIWPTGSTFHGVPVPPRQSRAAWADGMCRRLADRDFVFLDPDNGLGRSTPRHATAEEIKALRRPGRSIMLIKFPGRVRFDAQEDAYHAQLRDTTGATRIMTLRSSVTIPGINGRKVPRFRWFTLLDYDDGLAARMADFCGRLEDIQGVRASIRGQTETGWAWDHGGGR